MIEKKFYFEGSTLAEIQAIQKRTWIYQDQIIWVNEMPLISPFSININFDQMDILSKDMEKYVLIIDLRNSVRPDAKTRKVINERFLQIKDQLLHCAYITGKNNLANTAIRFVMYGMEHSHYSVSKNEEEALKRISKFLKSPTYEVQS